MRLRKAMLESFKTGWYDFGSKQLSSEQIMRMLDVLQGSEKSLKTGLSERANFEVALLKAVEQSRTRAINTLIRELDKLSGAPREVQKKIAELLNQVFRENDEFDAKYAPLARKKNSRPGSLRRPSRRRAGQEARG